ncbi:leucine-rich repeat domain-containing protein [Halosquirtibacter xylanolyticus]|uniref:leucine-rich repeat protein n=1 Tax=Halosquirtibacter xylanolyticus TaxID=3374599 RepID=UPI003749361F|nr:leucine-rich repeat domain-containing protein [Prolixibacteraceae bacterium]
MTYKYSSSSDSYVSDQTTLDDYSFSVTLNKNVELICKEFDNRIIINDVKIIAESRIALSFPDYVDCKPIVGISTEAFAGLWCLERINKWPYKLQYIEDRAFYNCRNLKSYVSLPDHLEFIGREVFAGCEKLSIVELPFYLRQIERCCFRGCDQLKLIVYNSLHSVEVLSKGKRVNRAYEFPLEVGWQTQLIVSYDIFIKVSNLSNYLVYSKVSAMNGR